MLTASTDADVPESENVEAAGTLSADSASASENVIVSVAPSAETTAPRNSGFGATVLLVTDWSVNDSASLLLRPSILGGESGLA